jgi:hypothetical protein
MIDASTKLARSVVGFGVIVAAGCTMAMNAKFGWSIGSDDLEKYMYAVFSVSLDICKLLGLGFVAHAWSKKYRAKALVALIVWVTAVAYSLVAAVGFAAMTRSHVQADRGFVSLQHQQKIDNHKVLAKELEAMKNNERYGRTAACTVPVSRMTTESKDFCHLFEVKTKEVADAAAQLPTTMIKDADPQMTFFASMTGIEVSKLIQYWAVALAIVAEIVASLGTYAFSSSRAKPVYVSKSGRVQEEVAETQGEIVQAVKRRPGRPKGSKNKPKLQLVA